MTKIFVLAGELSGDLHGGNVLTELVRLRPQLDIIGTGGKIIAESASELFYHVEDLEVIGFLEVAKRYNYYKGVFDAVVSKLDEKKPDAVLLIDYPGFNLKLAAEAKKRGIKVIYYIAPHVWAWKKNRVEVIKKYVDELIVLFPFEVDFFQKEGVKAHCFGHPLLDIVKPLSIRHEFLSRWGLDPDRKLISLLPGSRANELKNHLPLLVKTAEILTRSRDDLQFVLPIAPTTSELSVLPFLQNSNVKFKIIKNETYDAIAHAFFALVASGTATLETAILETPEVIFYKSSFLTYLIGKYVMRIKQVGLPNIIAGRAIVPEDPHFISPEKMAKTVLVYLENESEYQSIKQELKAVKSQLGDPGAYLKTAEFINSIL
ncbi:lipid-A-disaccharide synthase [bacterium]|nr:lipid-A-disaccharide synthase [bacterium]